MAKSLEQYIIEASEKMEKGSLEEAAIDIELGLNCDADNYELYYMKGLIYEQLGKVEDAYFAYKIAVFFGKESEDADILIEQFDNLCSYAVAKEYELGKALENLVISRVLIGEYDRTQKFLMEQLYSENRLAAGIVLSENNMLLNMMLEIVLCEARSGTETEFNTFARFNNDVGLFNYAYRELKNCIRRIWFGFELIQLEEINNVISQYNVSPHMLAVVAKYSVVEDYWYDVYERLEHIIADEHPMHAETIGQYRRWMAAHNTGMGKKCSPEWKHDNCADVINLEYNKEYKTKGEAVSGVQQDDDRIAFIMCTNDNLYMEECVRYLKRLIVPKGKSLEILVVWNAPGMAAGYNFAMYNTTARYKVYIHHDTFIIKRNALLRLVDEFKDEKCGMLGIAGSLDLQSDARWFSSSSDNKRMILYQDAILNILDSMSVTMRGNSENATAMDGIFLATQYDVDWREDIFDGWHYYDISECYEFRKNGYATRLINDDVQWVLHETTMKKDPNDLYTRYGLIFIEEYI